MARFRVGVIGTGKPVKPSAMGYAMAYQHGLAYQKLSEVCEIVACADIVPENGQAFAERFGFSRVYASHHEMLAAEKLDIVSICTWPKLHAPLVIDTARAGVRAIHCEKPMADTWAACKQMAAVCEEAGTRLTFNHQRRFGKPFRKAKELLDAGAIGNLLRIENGAGNLYDYGSHNFDMCGYFVGQVPAEWVIAQIDYRDETLVFGMHNENQTVATWRYANGVYGFASTGAGGAMVGCHQRLIGTGGIIEVGATGEPALRILRYGSGWEAIDCDGEGLHNNIYIERAIADVVGALQTGGESELSARNALQATEVIFGAWESARIRARVDLPLTVEDNPLESMVAEGALRPQRASSSAR